MSYKEARVGGGGAGVWHEYHNLFSADPFAEKIYASFNFALLANRKCCLNSKLAKVDGKAGSGWVETSGSFLRGSFTEKLNSWPPPIVLTKPNQNNQPSTLGRYSVLYSEFSRVLSSVPFCVFSSVLSSVSLVYSLEFFSCPSSSIPTLVTHWLTDSLTVLNSASEVWPNHTRPTWTT